MVILGSAIVHAKQSIEPLNIHISGLNFPGVTQFNHKGAYDLFLKDINQKANVNMQYDVMLPARAARLFYQKKADCVVPAEFYLPYYQGFDVIASAHFSFVDYVAFTVKPNAKVTSKGQLQGKKIGIVRGEGNWNLEKRFNIANAQYIELVDVKAMLGMLVKGKVDAVIHPSTVMLGAMQRFNVDTILYDTQSPILKNDLAIVCHKNSRTIEYLSRVDPLIRKVVAENGIAAYRAKVTTE